jgi:hypothetical protein
MLNVTPFLSKDELRPALNNIIYDGQWANATNAHIAIRWPHITDEITAKAPNIAAVFDNKYQDDSFLFDKNEYKKWVSELPIVAEIKDCEECLGDGEVEWEYVSNLGKTHYINDECPVCDGVGGTRTGEMVADPKVNYQISGAIFSQVNMSKIIHVMDSLSVDTCYFSYSKNYPMQGYIIKIDIYQILVMPINK